MTRTKFILLLIPVLSAGSYLGFNYIHWAGEKTNTPSSLIKAGTENLFSFNKPSVQSATTKGISLSEISKHDISSDCWLAISGMVYDISPYLKGKSQLDTSTLIEGCGTDATILFNTKPIPANSILSPESKDKLDKYLIGSLTN